MAQTSNSKIAFTYGRISMHYAWSSRSIEERKVEADSVWKGDESQARKLVRNRKVRSCHGTVMCTMGRGGRWELRSLGRGGALSHTHGASTLDGMTLLITCALTSLTLINHYLSIGILDTYYYVLHFSLAIARTMFNAQ